MSNNANRAESALREWPRPAYLDAWRRPSFLLEQYSFETPLIKKHADVQFWAGNRIGFLTQAAIDELTGRGRTLEQAIEALKKNLRAHFKADTEAFLASVVVADKDRNARTAAHLVMRWEAALGVPGETMVSSPDLYIRRFYDAGDWYRLSSPAVIRVILEGQGEGISVAVSPDLRYRVTRIAKGGDAFDEWEIRRAA